MPLKRSHSIASQAEIRLHSIDRDVLVIRGTTEEAASVRLTGSVVVTANEAITIKRIHLKLFSTLRLKWNDVVNTSRGQSIRPIRFDKVLFDHEWTDLAGPTSAGNSPSTSRQASQTNLAAMARQASGTNLSQLTGLTSANGTSSTTNGAGAGSGGGASATLSSSPSSSSLATMASASKTLSKGIHAFPFEIIIPGDVYESVEGLSGATLVYRMMATVERGRFSNNMLAKKHLRIVRTLGSDAFEMTQTISIENIWPQKVQYAIETPSKAVAIGSHVAVSFLMIPLLKGLKPGKVTVQLFEYTTLTSPLGPSFFREEKVYEEVLPAPLESEITVDRWQFTKRFKLPMSLSKATQDCEIGQYVKVTHKLKFAVALVNPDRHVSELRASLPIYLYISPHVSVSSIDASVLAIPGREPPEEQVLFESTQSSLNNSPSGDGFSAPPNYENHVYDRLWNDIPTSALESPTTSGQSSPGMLSRRASFDESSASGRDLASLDPVLRSQLTAGLRALENQQNRSAANSGSNSGSYSGPHSGLNSGTHSRPQSAVGFSASAGHSIGLPGTVSGVHTPIGLPGGVHSVTGANGHGGVSSTNGTPGAATTGGDYFSRATTSRSSPGSPMFSSGGSDIDVDALSRVPSYSTAVRTDAATCSDSDLAPGYDYDSAPSSPLMMAARPPPIATSAPGSSANLHSLNATLASLSRPRANQPNQANSGSGTGAETSSASSSATPSRATTPLSELRAESKYTRTHSSSALSSLLHRNQSSKSLFDNFRKKHH